jgi:hypothetical protein
MMMKRTQWLLLALMVCGCTSVPRYAGRTTIPSLRFSQTPVLDAIDQLSAQIMASDPDLKGVEIDRTPPKVIRPTRLDGLAHQMDELQTRYLESIQTDFGEPFVTFWADDISVREACSIISQLLSMQVVYRPTSIQFRFWPETVIFRTYSVAEGMIETLKSHTPPDYKIEEGNYFFLPPIWDDNAMMSLDDRSTILVIGSEDDHVEFEKELKKRQHNHQVDASSNSRASAPA